VEVQLHAFSTSALCGGGQLHARPLYPQSKEIGWVGPGDNLDAVEKTTECGKKFIETTFSYYHSVSTNLTSGTLTKYTSLQKNLPLSISAYKTAQELLNGVSRSFYAESFAKFFEIFHTIRQL
jgi:hypothetical protein